MKNMKKILLANILALSVSVPAFTVENSFIDELGSSDVISGDNALAVKEIKQKKFTLDKSEDNIADKIATEINEKNVAITNVSFHRIGSSKIYSLDQVKNVTINNSFYISEIDLKDNNKHFTITLKPAAGIYAIEAEGEYSVSQKVPLLVRSISKGEQISQDDVELKNYPKEKVNGITDINDIIGKSATKGLTKGKMVSEDDVRNPVVISKNSSVSAIYRSAGIEVKALAVAQEDGGTGDIIRLKNFDSGKIFKAVVQADGTVFIGNNTSNLGVAEADTKDDGSAGITNTAANISIDKNFN